VNRPEQTLSSVPDAFQTKRTPQTASPCIYDTATGMLPITNTLAGIKFKVENKNQYEEYLQELEPIREELGIPLKETMFPDEK